MGHGIEDVVARGMCIGCGGCSVRTSGAIPVVLGRYGMYEADLEGVASEHIAAGDQVCPFSDSAESEDQLSDSRFGQLPVDRRLGRHRSIFAGRIADDDQIIESSSGGLTSWFLGELLSREMVDGVIHVGRGETDQLFGYTISDSVSALVASRKSMYYSTALADTLLAVRGNGKTYAVVGVPCFIKAVRLLANDDPRFDRQFPWFVGLVCGHMKSQFFAESLAWQAGVPPDDLESIDFRVKNPARRSYAYDYEVRSRRGFSRLRRVHATVDGNWAYGAFQPGACNFCDDVFAETADVVFGDAWLPQFTGDWRGTNVVITRNDAADRILLDGAARRQIHLESLSADDAARSQAGNFRHRRDGLRVRLADDVAAGLSVPRKRVTPGYDGLTDVRIGLIRQRRLMSELSSRVFAEARRRGKLRIYTKPMRAAILRYRQIESPGLSLRRRAMDSLRTRLSLR